MSMSFESLSDDNDDIEHYAKELRAVTQRALPQPHQQRTSQDVNEDLVDETFEAMQEEGDLGLFDLNEGFPEIPLVYSFLQCSN
jgi:hypothetical protein